MTQNTAAADAQTIRASRFVGRHPVTWLIEHEDHEWTMDDPRGVVCKPCGGVLLLPRPEDAVDPHSPECPPELRAVVPDGGQRDE
jgi:hypothetical protein